MKRREEIAQRIQRMLQEERRETLDVMQVRGLIDNVFEQGMYVSSMEAFELEAGGGQPLRMEFSILGLDADWDDRAPKDAVYARQVLEAKLSAASDCANPVELLVWLDELHKG